MFPARLSSFLFPFQNPLMYASRIVNLFPDENKTFSLSLSLHWLFSYTSGSNVQILFNNIIILMKIKCSTKSCESKREKKRFSTLQQNSISLLSLSPFLSFTFSRFVNTGHSNHLTGVSPWNHMQS